MRTLPLIAAGAVALAGLTVVGATTSAVHAAPAYTAYALSGTNLLSFDIADPAEPTSTAITGVTAGESLVGLDVRPQNGQLYALGINATANTGTVYVVHEQNGVAAAVGTPGSVAFTSNGVTAIDLPDPATVGYGVDVNPAADRIRVVAGGLNFRVNPNTGAGIDGDNTGLASGSVSGTNPDGPIHGGTTSVDGSAYTNDVANNGNVTTLYTLDSTTDNLFIQSPANAGTQTGSHELSLSGSPLDVSAVGGFDIPSGVDVPASNSPVTSGSGYAVFSVGGTTSLFTVNLVTGATTLVGAIGTGATPVQGLALQRDVDEGYPAVGLSQDGNNLTRFSTALPSTTTTQAVNLAGLGAGETLSAIAWRPQTGQLLGLGVDSMSNTGSLYVVDPQTGAVTRIGMSFGLVAWVGSDGTTPVDLPDPATTSYAMDVNPSVDRIRLTVGGGLNARVNPNSGVAVDGDGAAGTNPDGATGLALTAVAYTNGFGNDLAGSVTTTLFAVSPVFDQVVTVNPPNSGTLTNPHTVTLGGATLDFSTYGGLDIPEDVPGTAYAALTVGGQQGLYTIDLATGVAVSVGSLAAPVRSLTIGQAGANRPVVEPPPPPPAAVPATLTKVGAAKQAKKTVDTGRTLACPSAFLSTSCTTAIKVTATYKVKVKGKTKTRSAVVGKATVKTARGKATRLKVTLSKAGVKLLKKQKTLAAKVAVTAPTGAKAAKRTTTVKVKLNKKKL